MQETLKKQVRAFITKALQLEAQAVVRRYEPRIVAVTGSVGKTSAKDAIFCVLASHARVRKSQKSFNSELGLPLTILGRPNAWGNIFRWMQNLLDGLFLVMFRSRYPEWLVLEVGADRPGDIQSVAKWLPVDIAVITRLPEVPVHVEFFSSPEEVVKEKAALLGAIKNLPPGREGTVILYADDARAQEFRELAGEARVFTFGFSPQADVRAEHVEFLYDAAGDWPVGMKAQLSVGGQHSAFELRGSLGAHALLPALAAAAVGLSLEMPLPNVIEALKRYEPPQGRMHLIAGAKNTLIIDDTYNASPAAVLAGLQTLKEIKAKRRVAVLGDMLELGRHSVEEHRKAGAAAASCADMLITVGFRARDIAQGALEAGMASESVLACDDSRAAGEELKALIEEGDCVFVKGSQGTRCERVVMTVMAEPERAKELLVRQEKEWKKR